MPRLAVHTLASRLIVGITVMATIVAVARVASRCRADPTSQPSSSHDVFGPRGQAARGAALKRFGGDRETERAVADGLAWLAAHQRADGVWDRRAFDRLCPHDDKCTQTAMDQRDSDADVGVSALAALAFLGAGCTHQAGPYADNLTKVFSFIIAQQRPDGDFAPGSGLQMYDDAVATLAIAEASALTGDAVFADPLRRAVRFLERAQQAEGGWDYTAHSHSARCDTSITGWVMMAFKSAQAAGVPASLDVRFKLLAHFDRTTEGTGRVAYASKPPGFIDDPDTGESRPRYGSSMTAVGLYASSVLGLRTDDPVAQRQIAILQGDLPDLQKMYRDKMQLHSEYYWYYGSLALFNLGGPAWEQWNAALRRSVMEYQERPTRHDGSHKHTYGSWPAFGHGWGQWGRTGSRIYSTAINTLTLEVYYRYEPAYLSPRGLIGPTEMRTRMAGAEERDQPRLLQLTTRLEPDTAEPLLLEFLNSSHPRVQLEAAIELGRMGSPRAINVLHERRQIATNADRQRIDRALADIDRAPHEFDCGGISEVSAGARMFLFESAGQPLYYGQRVSILRDGRAIAHATVTRRFCTQRAAAAKLDADAAGVRVGDSVTTREGRTESQATTTRGARIDPRRENAKTQP